MAITRVTPTGTKLTDGYPTKIAFEADTNVTFWEKAVTPPGVDGGDKIDQTTMFNATWRTYAARSLKELTDGSITVAYDPKVYDEIVALVNVETEITVKFSDLSTLSFFGYLKSFTPGELVEGEQPEAEVEFVCTNIDPASGTETGPTFVENATGT